MSRVAAARRVAFEVVRSTFERDAWTDRAFRAAADRDGLEPRERSFAQRLAYGAVQRRLTADHLVERLARREPEDLDPEVIAALRLGIYELLFAHSVPDHAAVDQAVALTREAGAGRGAGFVNAVLRRAARERASLLGGLSDADPDSAAIAHSVPAWLCRMWWGELGPEEARSLLAACNEPAETALRVNELRGSPDRVCEQLQRAGISARRPEAEPPLAPREVLVIDGPVGEVTMELVAEGVLSPQSRASAAVVDLLDPQPGERVLDLCAGPGTKTGAIAARMAGRGELVALELDAGRLRQVSEQAARLGVGGLRTVQGDAAAAELGGGYDRVLVDAPCSDLGTLASRPDARWRKSPRRIADLARLQGEILRNAVTALRPGGTLVYATCTISRRENEQQVAQLLEASAAGRVPPLRAEDLGARFPRLATPLDPRSLQVRPDRDRTTGFFITLLKRDD